MAYLTPQTEHHATAGLWQSPVLGETPGGSIALRLFDDPLPLARPNGEDAKERVHEMPSSKKAGKLRASAAAAAAPSQSTSPVPPLVDAPAANGNLIYVDCEDDDDNGELSEMDRRRSSSTVGERRTEGDGDSDRKAASVPLSRDQRHEPDVSVTAAVADPEGRTAACNEDQLGGAPPVGSIVKESNDDRRARRGSAPFTSSTARESDDGRRTAPHLPVRHESQHHASNGHVGREEAGHPRTASTGRAGGSTRGDCGLTVPRLSQGSPFEG